MCFIYSLSRNSEDVSNIDGDGMCSVFLCVKHYKLTVTR